MKNKAFTLLELLAVIIILSIILIITIPIINSVISSANLNAFVADEKMMVNATKLYLGTNEELLPSNIGDTIEIKLSTLQSDNLLDSIPNPWDNKDVCDGYILITKINLNEYDYTPYLKCENNYKADSYTTDGLVVYWKFNANAYDYTPNNNHGTIKNVTTTTNRFGVPNKALDFNGPSNFVDTDYDYSLDYDKGTTFSLWVKFAIDDTRGKIKNIFGKNNKEFILSQIDKKIKFTVWDDKGNYAIQLESNANIEIDKWYNIAIVYNNVEKQVYLYINGVIDNATAIFVNSFENKNGTFKIGRGFPDTGAASSTFFIGVIDNIYIYDRALSSFEIKLNYDVARIMKW